MDRNVGLICVDERNTVRTLRDKLQTSLQNGYADSGFPIVRHENSGMRVVGYIGFNELEHALGRRSVEFEIYINLMC